MSLSNHEFRCSPDGAGESRRSPDAAGERRATRVGGGLLLLAASLVFGLPGCTGAPANTDGELAAAPTLPEARIGETWPVKFATVESFAEFQTPGWITFVQKRDYRAALDEIGPGVNLARVHAEAAGLYRQAALVSANSAIETYAVTPEETDPIGAAHLLAVAWALRGDLDKAREASARLDAVADDPTLVWHAPWKAWLAAGATWPPDLSSLPIELPPPAAGAWPDLQGLPHYRMPVRTEGDHSQPMGDPGSLVALSLWHEAAAELAAGADKGSVDMYLARYAFPVEPRPADAVLPMAFLYASDLLVPEDGPFLADLLGDAGPAAVDAWKGPKEGGKGGSLMAEFASLARIDGKIDAERAVDVANGVRASSLEQAKKATNNEVQHHQRMFADIAYVGVLRILALVAEEEDNREQGGKLRILAMESSQDHTACTVALMTLAAWDTGNRYPSRAQEIIHRSESTYPSLEAARYGLDVLALRVSRERVETPGM